jgi:hypothetical protein
MVDCLEIVDPGAIVRVDFLAADLKTYFSDRLLGRFLLPFPAAFF